MKTYISFSEKRFFKYEKTLPIVKLTKSKNGETGTATFLFIRPSLFSEETFLIKPLITGIYLNWGKKRISTTDISIFFEEGKPFLMKGIFIFKNSQEWFHFLNFMSSYSEETGLLFSEKNSFS